MTETEKGEREARAYCRSIGADPDEFVHGVDKHRFGHGYGMLMARWRWYVGARLAVAKTGAH